MTDLGFPSQRPRPRALLEAELQGPTELGWGWDHTPLCRGEKQRLNPTLCVSDTRSQCLGPVKSSPDSGHLYSKGQAGSQRLICILMRDNVCTSPFHRRH